MAGLYPLAALISLVVLLNGLNRRPGFAGLFRWIPIPIWCYAVPMIAVSAGWIPHGDTAPYRAFANQLLPIALGLLLLGVDLRGVIHSGARGLAAMTAGAAGIIVGAPIGVLLLHGYLPAQAWKGAGALAGTWTGGTMNLLALRSVLNTPEEVFAPLMIVDPIVAYAWMAMLVAASGFQPQIDGWLRATKPGMQELADQRPAMALPCGRRAWTLLAACLGMAAILVAVSDSLAGRLPVSGLITSANAWRILLVTTGALALSAIPNIRRIGAAGADIGYACLYAVLAATGAQAELSALWSAPAWLLVGLCAVVIHGVVLLIAGRALKIPVGWLATASQANVGGVVSAPLVGAVYHQSLAPIGLVLAVAANAVGTYLGLTAAMLCRWLVRAT